MIVSDNLSIDNMASNNSEELEKKDEECSTENSTSPDPCVQPNEVADWLGSFNFSTYTAIFLDQGYDSLFVCSHLDESDLDLLQVTKPGHRKMLLLKSKELAETRNNIEAAVSIAKLDLAYFWIAKFKFEIPLHGSFVLK